MRPGPHQSHLSHSFASVTSKAPAARCSKPAEADAIHVDEADVPLLAYAVTCAFVLYAGSGGKF